MAFKIRFTKMHGIGNDFVVIDCRNDDETGKALQNLDLVRLMADRKFGIGCDQLLILKRAQSPAEDFRMEIFNTDGSIAEMCGNGIRAVALYVHKRDVNPKGSYRVGTLAGLKIVEILGTQVRVDMGPPKLGHIDGEDLAIPGAKVRFHEVSMGNPHAIIFVSSVDEPLPNHSPGEIGPLVETHARFPAKTNVEFTHVENEHAVRVRVWERGAGLTLACGTGACAAAVSAIATKRAVSPVTVHLPGGSLEIRWEAGNSSVFMTGPAVEVFSGEFATPAPNEAAR